MTARAYRLLLVLLPGWFREEFAREMTAVFVDSMTDARREGAAAALWLRTLVDLVRLAARLHGDAIRQDLSYAVRTLARTPTFTIAIVATLALGLGPTVVVANFFGNVVLSPLPFPEPERLVRVWNTRPERQQSQIPLSLADYLDYRERQTVFSAFAAHTGTSIAIVIGGVPRQVSGVLTSPDLHAVLGVRPVLGRMLGEDDAAPGAPHVILLGATLWRSEFGSRPSVIGEVLQVDGEPTTIVGVLPETFEFPVGTNSVWVPLTLDRANTSRGSRYLTATGRLKPGISEAQASSALNGIARALGDQYPDTNGGQLIELAGLKEQLNGDAPRLLAVLLGAIAAVLLIACLNVASLLTVRATVRGTEFAVRTALGASGRRLRRQLMVEHLALTAAGGAVAAGLGVALHRILIARRVLELPSSASSLEWPAFALLAALVVVIGAAFAGLTGRRYAGKTIVGSLTGGSRQTGRPSVLRAREVLVAGEVAAALVLLVIGGLMIRSAARLAAVDPGFRTESVLTFGVVLPTQDYQHPEDRARFVTRVVDALRVLPGVRQAAAGAYAPMGDMRGTRRFAPDEGPTPAPGTEPIALDLPVGPGYFEVMGISLVGGRLFTDRDAADAPPVMIVSESLARTMFPGQRAIGKHLRFFASRPGGTPPPTREIVGVVRDVRQDGVARAPMMQMYAPYAQNAWGFVSFFVLAEGDASHHAATVQRVVNSIDPMRPVRDVLTIDTILAGSTARHRAMTWMLIALATTALLLATIGLYGVSATAASARVRELAIRAAVGAEPSSLLRLMLRQGLAMGAAGIVVGSAVGLAATRGLGALLFETAPSDPLTFVGTGLLLLFVAVVAAYFPARRVVGANPAEVLRAD